MADFRGDSTDNRLDGTSGNDEIRGLKGDDELFGNGGNDRIFGNKGDDTIDGGAGDDELVGGRGGDTFVFGAGHGNDVITDFKRGGDSIDLSALDITGLGDVTAAQTGNGLELDLTAHGGGTILLKGFNGSLDAADFIFFVNPVDMAYFRGDSTDNRLDGTSGNDWLFGRRGDDELFGNGGNDVILGNKGDDTIDGGAGHDELVGGGGADTIDGGAGDDVLVGSMGGDTIDGGAGDDKLVGGWGGDTFVFGVGHGNDVIIDFRSGKDSIDFSALGITGLDVVAVPGDVMATQTGNGVKLDLTEYGGGTILLKYFDIADLDAGDFLF